VRHIVETLRGAGATDGRFVAVGGGTHNRVWMQIVSDVLGSRQEVPRVTVGASYGDALLAAMAAGLVEPHTRWNTLASVVEPADHAGIYDSLYHIYRDLYRATRQQAHALAALQEGGG